MSNYEQIVNGGLLYINGMVQSNDATTPNTVLDVSPGICRDSTNSFDINLGNYLGANPNIDADQVTSINAAANGVNGLDEGTFAADTLYNVFVIGDIRGYNSPACLLSTSSTPLLPFGYGMYRLIGYAATDASIHFLKMYVAGNNNARVLAYDAPQATAVTAGNATSFTAVDLSAFVPAVDNTPVSIAYAFTPGAASRVLNLTPGNGVGDAWTITGQVTSVVISGNASLMAKVSSGVPEIDYKVTNAGDAVALNVAGFEYFI